MPLDVRQSWLHVSLCLIEEEKRRMCAAVEDHQHHEDWLNYDEQKMGISEPRKVGKVEATNRPDVEEKKEDKLTREEAHRRPTL